MNNKLYLFSEQIYRLYLSKETTRRKKTFTRTTDRLSDQRSNLLITRTSRFYSKECSLKKWVRKTEVDIDADANTQPRKRK